MQKTGKTIRILEQECEACFSEGVLLSEHTSFGIGGPASIFVEVQTKTMLRNILGVADKLGLKLFVLGGGTNLLVSDIGFDGLVIKISSSDIHPDPEHGELAVDAGALTASVVEQSIALGLGGLEFAAGLPGSIGGALVGNAGCFGHSLGERLKRATIISRAGAELEVDNPGWFAFDYRYSKVLGSGSVLIDATFELTKAESERLRAVADDHISQRTMKHPSKGTRTAGSYFKNLPPLGPGEPRRAAGLLLDEVGARDLCVGDAAVFEKHANIVVNKGRATAQDVLELTQEMARRVRERFAIELIPEVRFVGEQ